MHHSRHPRLPSPNKTRGWDFPGRRFGLEVPWICFCSTVWESPGVSTFKPYSGRRRCAEAASLLRGRLRGLGRLLLRHRAGGGYEGHRRRQGLRWVATHGTGRPAPDGIGGNEKPAEQDRGLWLRARRRHYCTPPPARATSWSALSQIRRRGRRRHYCTPPPARPLSRQALPRTRRSWAEQRAAERATQNKGGGTSSPSAAGGGAGTCWRARGGRCRPCRKTRGGPRTQTLRRSG